MIFQKSVLSAAVFAAAAPVVSEDSPHLRRRGASIDPNVLGLFPAERVEAAPDL